MPFQQQDSVDIFDKADLDSYAMLFKESIISKAYKARGCISPDNCLDHPVDEYQCTDDQSTMEGVVTYIFNDTGGCKRCRCLTEYQHALSTASYNISRE